MRALDGMKVLDLTHWEAGPSCTQLLAWLGADVVKVEQAGVGDAGRHTELGFGDSLYFLSYNANKRSLALDLKSEAGRRVFLDLVPRFDVVIENFSLGIMEAMGLGYDVLKAANPKIIYATIKGFGTYGPYANYRCYDPVSQAAGGIFAITGDADGPPVKPGSTMGDTGSGLVTTVGILAAYTQAQRTGMGQVVEVSMQEAVLNFTRTSLSHRERGDATKAMPRRGTRSTMPSDLFPCAPGGPNDYVYIMVMTTRMWDTFTVAIDRPELSLDERFLTSNDRDRNGDALFEIIAEWTRQRTKFEVMEHLGAAGVPCSAVLDSLDVLSNEHLQARDAIIEVDHPQRGRWQFLAPPVRLSESPVEVTPAPQLGQHSAEVLSEYLGLDEAAVEALVQAGAVGLLHATETRPA